MYASAIMVLILMFFELSLAMATNRCREPLIEESCINSPDAHESFLMLESHNTDRNDIKYFKDVSLSALQSSDKNDCTWQTTGRYNSTCPHHYVINRDPNRRPEVLLEAKCNCKRCLNGDGKSRCMPVKYYINVLRKNKCENGVYGYVPTVEAINVGCTCVYPLTTSSRPRYVMHN